MQLKNLLTKSLLVAGMLAGSSNAWGELTPFSESYTSSSTATGWTTGTAGRYTPAILNDDDNYYLSVDQDSRYNNGATVTGTILSGKAKAGDDFTLIFDIRLGSHTDKSKGSAEFIIKDVDNSGTMLSLVDGGNGATTWTVNGSSTKYTLDGSNNNTAMASKTWYTVKLSRAGSYTYVTITKKSDASVVMERSIVTASATGGLGNIIFNSSRYYSNFAIDNIVLRAIESGDVPVAEPTTCTVKFQDSEGTTLKTDAIINTLEGETVNANDYVAAFNEAGKKYIYVSGNTPITAVADPSSNVITLVFREASTWNYAINAVDGEDNQITVIASGSAFEGDTKKTYFPKSFVKEGVWYQTSSGSNGASYYSFSLSESTKTKNITYTVADDIDYFFECEDLTVVNKRDDGSVADRGSNGAGIRLGIDGYIYTSALNAGTYTLKINWNNPNSGTPIFNIKLWDGEKLIDTGKTIKKTSASSSDFAENSTSDIIIPEGMALAICNNTGYNGNPTFDYIILERTSDATVSKSITSAGWATYCSPYALDLENATGLEEAYIVTDGAAGVLTKTSVKGGTVPANTGLLLKADEGTVTIPVVASSSTDVSDNKLVGKTAEYALAAEGGYVLMATGSNGLGFYKNSNEFTVGANTAYLPANFDGALAPEAFYSFLDSETTGISGVGVDGIDTQKEGVFNLNGQRVAQPTKGLYIVGGKKVLFK